MAMHRPTCLLAALVPPLALLLGCSASIPVASGAEATPLEGQATFPAYRVQADFAEVATAATISLIDPGANQTIATSVTDSAGRFRLRFSGFRPAKQAYVLEATKGLGQNAVGADAVRIRTLIAWNGSAWTSVTSSLPNLPVFLDASTTALCVIQSLRQGGASAVDPSVLIGTVTPGSGTSGEDDHFTEGATGILSAEFAQARGLVLTALLRDVDPIDAILFSSGAYAFKPGILSTSPVILSGVLPQSAAVGLSVTLLGTGFATSPSASTVSFSPSVVAPILAASASALTVTVPPGAQSGTLTLETNGVVATTSFTIVPLVNGGIAS